MLSYPWLSSIFSLDSAKHLVDTQSPFGSQILPSGTVLWLEVHSETGTALNVPLMPSSFLFLSASTQSPWALYCFHEFLASVDLKVKMNDQDKTLIFHPTTWKLRPRTVSITGNCDNSYSTPREFMSHGTFTRLSERNYNGHDCVAV